MTEQPEVQPSSSEDEAARKKRYKKTLNLPRTSFAMKANLRQKEPASLERWRDVDLYHRVLEARADAQPYVFHDGPPYANGSIHTGHLQNKVLKDLVVRSRNMLGYRCPYVPGWDCHGLPIEHRVMTDLVEKGKTRKLEELPEATRRMAIRRECAAYASKYQKLQSDQQQRLLTFGDYSEPYMTMAPEYEQSVLEVFTELLGQGIVYRDLKPVHWSIANETALAEAELEYQDREDLSIYVWFDAGDPAAVAQRFGAELGASDLDRLAFMIWTTTPWTLPANLLIAVHPAFEYSLVRLGDRLAVIASELVEAVAEVNGDHGSVETLGRARGKDLLGLAYRHPFCDQGPDGAWRIVEATYVTLEDGTGLVHTAPGHGAEDFATGQAEGLPVYCPVQADGTYDDTVPERLRGMSIWDANQAVVDWLQESGHLYFVHSFVHSYPHDWRSKTPVVFRCTEQWFVAVDRPLARDQRSLRECALEAAREKIQFVPGWGRNRLIGMLESRPDWCISRQRSWGLPIPAFRLPDGSVFLSQATVRAVAEVFGREGSDAWFTKAPSDLLAGYDPDADPEAPAGLDTARLDKTYDIFDVWFESGSSWNAVIRRRGLGYPADLYLEGSDQHRGWFQLSLLPALAVTGESPFRELVTHGFIADKDGLKMSKSLGNTLEVEDLLRDFGADVCRWWVSSLAFEKDIRVDREFFALAGESYRKVRNTLRFLLGNLADFTECDAVDLERLEPTSLDAWALTQAAALEQAVRAAYERFDFRDAHLRLFDFCNDTLSAVYLDAVKDRLYCDRPDSPRRRATQSSLRRLTEVLTVLLAPMLPHTADEAYRALLGADDPETTVHLSTCPDLQATADQDWVEVMRIGEEVGRQLERAKERGIDNPIDAGLVIPDPHGLLARFAAELPDLFGVSRVTLDDQATAIEVVDLSDQPRCERSWRRDATVRQRSDGGWLSDRDADAVGVA